VHSSEGRTDETSEWRVGFADDQCREAECTTVIPGKSHIPFTCNATIDIIEMYYTQAAVAKEDK